VGAKKQKQLLASHYVFLNVVFVTPSHADEELVIGIIDLIRNKNR